MKKQDLFRLAALGALVLAMYIPTFIWMVDRWSVKDTYYSHGFLVPFISAFLVWMKRKTLGKIKITPLNAAGWALFGIGIFTHALSAFWRVHFTSGLSMLLVIPGLVLLFFGKETLKQVLFPIAFLIFMIPLPLVAIANLSFKLKIFAAQIATLAVNGLGVMATRDGSLIRTMHAQVMVEDPCSGIRSLIALIALGALMAYFNNSSKIKKAILFLSSIPIAIGTNIIRITALTLASEIYGDKFASGVFHDTMGIVVFVLAFLGLSLVGKVME